MQLPATIQQAREQKVQQMMTQTGCDRDRAITYLMTAGWHLPDAIDNHQTTRRPFIGQQPLTLD